MTNLYATPTAAAFAARKATEWTAERDARIVAARSGGYSLRVIADATGLSHQTISNICGRARS